MQFFFKKTPLETLERYTFNHYDCFSIDLDIDNDDISDNRILSIFKDMYNKYLDTGGIHIPGKFQIDGAILLEDENEVVAGIFYDLQKSLSSVYILLAVTNDGHRKKGIYKKMHSLIDVVGKSHGRVGVTSFMGLDNNLLTDTIARTVGYKPIFQVMHRPIKKWIQKTFFTN